MSAGAETQRAALPRPDDPGSPDRSHLSLVTARRPRRLGRLTRLLSLLTVAAILVVLFGLAAFHASLAQGQFELDELQNQVADLTGQRAALDLSIQELEAPQRVASIAAELGLSAPERTVDLTTDVDEVGRVLDRSIVPAAPPGPP